MIGLRSAFIPRPSFSPLDANGSSRNASARRNVSEDEALLFINGRMTENEWSATFK